MPFEVAKGHQLEGEMASMGNRKDINGKAKRHQLESERILMEFH
jgi:hypothetical protein